MSLTVLPLFFNSKTFLPLMWCDYSVLCFFFKIFEALDNIYEVCWSIFLLMMLTRVLSTKFYVLFWFSFTVFTQYSSLSSKSSKHSSLDFFLSHLYFVFSIRLIITFLRKQSVHKPELHSTIFWYNCGRCCGHELPFNLLWNLVSSARLLPLHIYHLVFLHHVLWQSGINLNQKY